MTWIKKRNILNLGIGIVGSANIQSIKGLYDKCESEWAVVRTKNGIVGWKRAKKIVDALEKSKTVTLPDFLGSIGIKGVGRSLMSNLCEYFSCLPTDTQLTIDDIFQLTEKRVAKCEGFGVVRAANFYDWLREHKEEVLSLGNLMDFQYEQNEKSDFLDGEVICFTGKSPRPRSEMAKLAEGMGASTTGSVTSSTTILVIADPNSISSKAVKARKAGIELMSPEKFLARCGE
jgi:DNA ligase (NAD+)